MATLSPAGVIIDSSSCFLCGAAAAVFGLCFLISTSNGGPFFAHVSSDAGHVCHGRGCPFHSFHDSFHELCAATSATARTPHETVSVPPRVPLTLPRGLGQLVLVVSRYVCQCRLSVTQAPALVQTTLCTNTPCFFCLVSLRNPFDEVGGCVFFWNVNQECVCFLVCVCSVSFSLSLPLFRTRDCH
jgi:hypothetical protein